MVAGSRALARRHESELLTRQLGLVSPETRSAWEGRDCPPPDGFDEDDRWRPRPSRRRGSLMGVAAFREAWASRLDEAKDAPPIHEVAYLTGFGRRACPQALGARSPGMARPRDVENDGLRHGFSPWSTSCRRPPLWNISLLPLRIKAIHASNAPRNSSRGGSASSWIIVSGNGQAARALHYRLEYAAF